MDMADTALIKQHLIDPEICIRCGACEAACPIDAITHDDRNYVVDVNTCESCRACVPVCPTGAIDNWLTVPRAAAYSLEQQFSWDQLPPELTLAQLAEFKVGDVVEDARSRRSPSAAQTDPSGETPFNPGEFNAPQPPWSAAHAYTNLYGPRAEQRASPPRSPAACA